MRDPWKNGQWVWPKDSRGSRAGPNGRHGRLMDIMTGKGPDIFIARKGEMIRPDRWGNWDSYHDHRMHIKEQSGRESRHFERYDPAARKYVKWSNPHDWFNIGIHGLGVEAHGVDYPKFTKAEEGQFLPTWRRGHRVVPEDVSNWTQFGPNRFQQQYDHFWAQAHRVGENRAEGFPDSFGMNPVMQMHQQWEDDKQDWAWNQYGHPQGFK